MPSSLSHLRIVRRACILAMTLNHDQLEIQLELQYAEKEIELWEVEFFSRTRSKIVMTSEIGDNLKEHN